jgi:uridylate kinase
VIFKATKVDGVYDSDPKKNPNAKRFDELSYIHALNEQLGVMDATAISLCMDNKLPIVVFDMQVEGNIKRALSGEPIGTLVHADG